MTVDVDAVNERLNGLVNLLHIVGIDGVDPDKLIEEQKKIAQKSDSAGIPTSAQSSDAQILEIIKQLREQLSKKTSELNDFVVKYQIQVKGVAGQDEGSSAEPSRPSAGVLV